MSYDPPSATYIEAKLQGGKQRPSAIIIRPSFTGSFDGAALAVAQFWNRSSSFWESAHYTVDNAKRFRCVRDNVIAGVSDVDRGAIRIAVCADPFSTHTFWDEREHGIVLRKTAVLVAELSLAYGISTSYLDEEGFAKWKKSRFLKKGGIYIYEPSGWPWQNFKNEVMAQRALKTYI